MKKIVFFCFFVFVTSLQAGVHVAGKMSQKFDVSSDSIVTGTIPIHNDGETAARVKVVQADYLFSFDGSNDFGDPGSHDRSNARWITFGQESEYLQLGPGQKIELPYTIHVPKDESLNGTYWSLLIVEPERPPVSMDDNAENVNLGLSTVIRYAVQLVTNIEGTGDPLVKVLGSSVEEEDGKKQFFLDLENQGSAAFAPCVRLELFDQDGTPLPPVESNPKNIYPNCSVRHVVSLDNLPKGTYKGLAIFDAKTDHLFGANIEIAVE